MFNPFLLLVPLIGGAFKTGAGVAAGKAAVVATGAAKAATAAKVAVAAKGAAVVKATTAGKVVAATSTTAQSTATAAGTAAHTAAAPAAGKVLALAGKCEATFGKFTCEATATLSGEVSDLAVVGITLGATAVASVATVEIVHTVSDQQGPIAPAASA